MGGDKLTRKSLWLGRIKKRPPPEGESRKVQYDSIIDYQPGFWPKLGLMMVMPLGRGSK